MKYRRKFEDEASGDGSAGGGSGNWRDTLPDELKGDPSLANFEDVGQLAKSFVDTKSYQGNSISIPGEDAGDEARQQFTDKLLEKAPNVMMRPDFDKPEQSVEFYRTLGMPEKSDGYGTPEIKDMPEGANPNPERLDFFRGIAHDAGLSKAQFNKIMTAVIEQDISSVTDGTNARKEDMDGLAKEWGMATEERMGQAKSILEKTKAPESLVNAFNDKSLSSDLVKWIHGLATSIGSEGNNLGNNDLSNNSKITPQEAQEKINEIYANKDHPFHKGDKAAMARMIELVSAKNPSASRNVDDLRRGFSVSQ